MLKSFAEKHGNCLYTVFRVLVGLMFMMHGGQKLFGWFGNGPMPFWGLMGAAGVIELVVGLGVAFGLFTRLLALLGGAQMVVAYFMSHAGNGWNPLVNKGELALMYFAAFLILMKEGNGKNSVEKSVLGKETF